MAFQLKYNPIFRFSSGQIFDATETPLSFEAHTRQSSEWAALAHEWIRGGAEDVERALDLIGMAIIAVSQEGQRYPLGGREGAEALRTAIEESSPGSGDTFIKHLALGHYHLHFRTLEERLGN